MNLLAPSVKSQISFPKFHPQKSPVILKVSGIGGLAHTVSTHMRVNQEGLQGPEQKSMFLTSEGEMLLIQWLSTTQKCTQILSHFLM